MRCRTDYILNMPVRAQLVPGLLAPPDMTKAPVRGIGGRRGLRAGTTATGTPRAETACR